MKNLSERIIEALKKSKRISDTDIQKALALHAKEGGKLSDVLVKMDLISEKELLSLLGDELSMPFLNLAKYKIDADVGKMIPEKLARKYQIVPISRMGKTLTLAVADPFNILAVDDIAAFTKHKVDCVLSTEKEILASLDRLYSADGDDSGAGWQETPGAKTKIEFEEQESEHGAFALSAEEASNAPTVKTVDTLLREALKKRASTSISSLSKRSRACACAWTAASKRPRLF